MDIGTALVGGAIGLASGLVTGYAAMRFRLREERAKWTKDLALKYALARADSPPVASSLAEQFGKFLLIVHEPGKERQKRFLLPHTRVVVGRADDVEINITDAAASKRHSAFEMTEAGAFLVDLGTHSGTVLNGTRVDGSVRLEAGDIVTIGTTQITFLQL